MKPGNTLLGFVLVLRLSIAFAQDEEDVFEELRGKKFKKWRQNKPPKVCVRLSFANQPIPVYS